MGVRGKDGADYDDVNELMKANSKWEQQEKQNKLLEEQNRLRKQEMQQNEMQRQKELEMQMKVEREKIYEEARKTDKIEEQTRAIEMQNKLLQEQLFLQVATPEEIEEYKKKKQEEKEAERIAEQKRIEEEQQYLKQKEQIKETEKAFSKMADSLIDKLNIKIKEIDKVNKKESVPMIISFCLMFSFLALGALTINTLIVSIIFIILSGISIIAFILACKRAKTKDLDIRKGDILSKIDYLKARKKINDINEAKYVLSFMDILSKEGEEFCTGDICCEEYMKKATKLMLDKMTDDEIEEYARIEKLKKEKERALKEELFEKEKDKLRVQLESLEDGPAKERLRAKIEELEFIE